MDAHHEFQAHAAALDLRFFPSSPQAMGTNKQVESLGTPPRPAHHLRLGILDGELAMKWMNRR